MNIEAIKQKYSSPSELNNRSDIFVSICKRYTALTLDYSIPADVKIELQEMLKQEMEMLMQSKN
jgi:hypothetical protein